MLEISSMKKNSSVRASWPNWRKTIKGVRGLIRVSHASLLTICSYVCCFRLHDGLIVVDLILRQLLE